MNLSAENETLLRRWIAGELTRREEAELEARAREDNFLAEALAGLRRDPGVDHGAALGRLRERLVRPATRKKEAAWPRIAAAVLLLAVAGTALWIFSPGQPALAELAEARSETTPESTAASPVAREPAATADVATARERERELRIAPPTTEEKSPANLAAPPRPREVITAAGATSGQAAAPVPVSPPVSRNVPPVVTPEAYATAPPPPPPNPATAGMTSRSTARALVPTPSAAEMPTEYSSPAAPVPYSVGAQSVAADTPNSIPPAESDAMEAGSIRNKLTTAAQKSTGKARTVRGYVRDADHAPLSGTMVTTPGVPVGMFTDSAGYFELRIDRTVDRLLLSNTGYADEEIAIEDSDNYLEVTLGEDVTESVSMDEAFGKATFYPDERRPMVAPPSGYRELRRRLREEKPAGLPAGRVRLEFTITETGKLRRFNVLETPDKRLSAWLIDRLRQTGDWKFYRGEGPHTVRYSVKFE